MSTQLQSLTSLARRHTPASVKRVARAGLAAMRPYLRRGVFRNRGVCVCCQSSTWFVAANDWFRDSYRCVNCESIPRERALMWVLDHFRPTWPDEVVHESSPVNRGASVRLAAQCSGYVSSQFFMDVPSGQHVKDMRCENLEAMSFADASVDVHVTQDVLEHVFDPDAVFREVARTLAPGGMHIFTTPLVNKQRRSERAASLVNGEIVHHLPPEYHGNPVSSEGSLVTMQWGYDITEHISRASGLATEIVYLDALELGIRAEYIEVLVTRKPAA